MAKRPIPGIKLPGDRSVITYADYGDWVAVWHNDEQIYFHDDSFGEVLHKIAKVVGFDVEALDLGPLDDDDGHNETEIRGPLQVVKEAIKRAEASKVEREIAVLKDALREREEELDRIKSPK